VSSTAVDLEEFLAEARRTASLDHPHIVRVLECDVEDGTRPYLVMDYAPGGTLRHRYPKGSCVPPALIISMVQQASSALRYVHDKGLIHRDVKPENMLLGKNDEVMLSDFGVAAIAHQTTSQSTQDQYAFDANTGAVIWTYTTGDVMISPSPMVISGIVFMGSDDNKLYALDASTGTVLWSFNIGSFVEDEPAIANGIVYVVGTRNGTLYAFHLG
jgi:serine/threonine protein kinase